MSEAPTPVSPDTSFGPTYFAEWVERGPAEVDKICPLYASFPSADPENVGELLSDITKSEEGGYVTLGV